MFGIFIVFTLATIQILTFPSNQTGAIIRRLGAHGYMASRGKGKEKEKLPQQQAASPEQPQEREVVPGKLSEKEW